MTPQRATALQPKSRFPLRLLSALTAISTLLAAIWLCSLPVQAQDAVGTGGTFDLHAAIRNAAAGDTILVPAGTYAAPIVIDKPLTLEGQGLPALVGSGDGDVVQITAPNVTLRGFAIRGSGASLDREDAGIRVAAEHVTVENNVIEDALFGIYYEEAPFGVIRGNSIMGKVLPESRRGDALKIFYSADSLIENNHLSLTRDSVIWFSPRTNVLNNVMENGRYGLHFMSTDDHLIEGNILRGNSVAIYLMYGSNYTVRNNVLAESRGASGYGLGLKETNKATVEGNRIVGNRVGIYSDASPLRPDATVTLRRNLLAYNEIGLLFLPNVQHNVITENIFLENGEQANISGGGVLAGNDWSFEGRGNYWSDYHGFDADGNSIGELPYESHSLYESLVATYPGLRLFALSPASDAVDLAARAFPIFQPRPILADPFPLTVAPTLTPVAGLPESPIGQHVAVALGLLTIAALVLGLGLRGFAPRRFTVALSRPTPLAQSSGDHDSY